MLTSPHLSSLLHTSLLGSGLGLQLRAVTSRWNFLTNPKARPARAPRVQGGVARSSRLLSAPGERPVEVPGAVVRRKGPGYAFGAQRVSSCWMGGNLEVSGLGSSSGISCFDLGSLNPLHKITVAWVAWSPVPAVGLYSSSSSRGAVEGVPWYPPVSEPQGST